MGTIGAIWGLGGVLLLIGSAIYRLTPIAADAFSYSLLWYHWLVLAVFLAFMLYAEGYRGFQQRFSPRVAARARHLLGHPEALHVALGPFFCMAYFHAPRRRKATSISLTLGIVVLIVLVRLLPQPWRGIIDVGVVAGLAWGVVSLAVFSIQAFVSEDFPYSPEVPEGKKGPQAPPGPSGPSG
jgi:hypothetical protein